MQLIFEFDLQILLLQLVDEETGAVQREPWKPGELLLRSEAVMKGYLNNVEETKKVIDSNKWLHTGNSFPIYISHLQS